MPAIQKGFREAIEKGPLTGSPVMGVRVVLQASSHVTVVSQSCHSRVTVVSQSCNSRVPPTHPHAFPAPKDGAAHAVDSSELAFRAAAQGGFREAMKAGSPLLLEPVMDVEISVPAEYQGSTVAQVGGALCVVVREGAWA